MAPGGGPARTQWRHTSTNMLLGVAEAVLQQAESGAEPQLSASQLIAAQRAIIQLRAPESGAIAENNQPALVWTVRGRSSAALMALLALSLRKASPFAVGDGDTAIFNDICGYLCGQVKTLTAEVIGSALLPTAAPQCLSRLLATAAEQLQPAAAAALARAAASTYAAVVPGVHPAAAGRWPMDEHHNHQQQQQQQQQGGQQRHQALGPQLPTIGQLDIFLRAPSFILAALGMVAQRVYVRPEDVPEDDSGRRNDSSSSASNPQIDISKDVCAQVQSSWVLEHWARVLLLGTAPALAGGDSAQQQEALALHANTWHVFTLVCPALGLDWSAFLRRPWACTLAATHMAYLCAALDGGHAFGWPRPDVVVLGLCTTVEDYFQCETSAVAREHDTAAMEAGRLVSLQAAVCVLRGWILLLPEALQEAPDKGKGAVEGQHAAGAGADGLEGTGQGGVGAEGGRAAGAAAAVPAADGQGTAAAGVQAGADDAGVRAVGAAVEAPAGVVVGQPAARGGGRGIGAGQGEAGDTVAPPNQGRVGPVGQGSRAAAPGLPLLATGLPPLHRSSTITLCLRLAKGVLARWGGELAGVRLINDRGSWGSVNPLLPKAAGCALLYHALACARLALLPVVWGRERMPRRTRAQLREWWETCVAAAQHPEALTMVDHEDPLCGKSSSAGPSALPSADASAALAAGLLPCMTRLVTRMGAGSGGGAVWCPPDSFPGAAVYWPDVLLHGPLGQVGELVSAVGRRLRLAVEELRRTAAGGVRAGHRGGRSVERLLEVAAAAMRFARARLVDCDVSPEVDPRKCSGKGGAGAAELGRESLDSPLARAHTVRRSYAAAELLPLLSQGVLVFAELGRRLLDAGGGVGVTAKMLCELVMHGGVFAETVCGFASMLLCTELHEGVAGGPEGEVTTGAGGTAGAGDSGGGTPWQQLLLRDVQLMELLGAGFELRRLGQLWFPRVNLGIRNEEWYDYMRNGIRVCVPLAAAVFPAEFRAAAAGSAPCMSLPAVREVLGCAGAAFDAQLGVVNRVLGGWEPSAEEVREMARACMRSKGITVDGCAGGVRTLMSPAEARAAVAAAVAAVG